MMSSPKYGKVGIVDVEFGENVKIIEPSNIYGCYLSDDVFIGPFVEIQKNTRIGAGTKIQSHTFVCEYVNIGESCFIGHGVMFANDMFKEGKPNPNPNTWGRINIGNNVTIGSNATILDVKICNNVVVGAGSVVTRDITESGIYAGNPAKKLRDL
ncbi:acyltransferase [Endozoicomonas lisbonensis]|uniref:Acetyltransferase-like isoleucine patch superfamily enzyme n=1 Tax=Endozoicomonas lisbonensis TaxID=3120522 RepID=A0ABV2SCU1_9GAMM